MAEQPAPPPQLPPAPAPHAAAAPPAPEHEVADAVTAALRIVVSQPDLYLIKAAQASTLRQLKAARKLLRDFNAAARHQLEQQAEASGAAVQHLAAVRRDLDAAFANIRAVKQQLQEQQPQLYEALLQQLAAAQD